MVDVNKLKGAIRGAGYTQADVARLMGNKPVTFNVKVNKGDMSVGDVQKLVEILNLNWEEALPIFFAKKS